MFLDPGTLHCRPKHVRPRVNTFTTTRGAARRTSCLRSPAHLPADEQPNTSAGMCRAGAQRFGCVAQDRSPSPMGQVGAPRHGRSPLLAARSPRPTTSRVGWLRPLESLATTSSASPGNSRVQRASQLQPGGPLGLRGVHVWHQLRGLTLRSTRRPPATRQGREAAQHYHRPRGPGSPLAAARYLKR
jgi:hypothetical protein